MDGIYSRSRRHFAIQSDRIGVQISNLTCGPRAQSGHLRSGGLKRQDVVRRKILISDHRSRSKDLHAGLAPPSGSHSLRHRNIQCNRFVQSSLGKKALAYMYHIIIFLSFLLANSPLDRDSSPSAAGRGIHNRHVMSNFQTLPKLPNASASKPVSLFATHRLLERAGMVNGVIFLLYLPVSFLFSSLSLASSPSLHSIPSSPTAKIVSPSRDSLGLGWYTGGRLLACAAEAGAGEGVGLGVAVPASPTSIGPSPVEPTVRSRFFRAGRGSSSSDKESAMLRISKPSSS